MDGLTVLLAAGGALAGGGLGYLANVFVSLSGMMSLSRPPSAKPYVASGALIGALAFGGAPSAYQAFKNARAPEPVTLATCAKNAPPGAAVVRVETVNGAPVCKYTP